MGFSLSSPHVVTEEQGMCKLPPERRFGAKILAEQARVPGWESVLKLQVGSVHDSSEGSEQVGQQRRGVARCRLRVNSDQTL